MGKEDSLLSRSRTDIVTNIAYRKFVRKSGIESPPRPTQVLHHLLDNRYLALAASERNPSVENSHTLASADEDVKVCASFVNQIDEVSKRVDISITQAVHHAEAVMALVYDRFGSHIERMQQAAKVDISKTQVKGLIEEAIRQA